MPLPKKNVEYITYTSLADSANPGKFKSNPTISTGDFKYSLDGSALSNLATLPTVDPAGSSLVKITVSASEMNGEKLSIVAIDAAGNEWDDAMISIDIPETNIETIGSGIIKANQAGSFPLQMKDNFGLPSPSAAVSAFVSIDGGAFVPATGTATTTDSDGFSYMSYTASDVTGTKSVSFKFTATGAVNTYERFLLSV